MVPAPRAIYRLRYLQQRVCPGGHHSSTISSVYGYQIWMAVHICDPEYLWIYLAHSVPVDLFYAKDSAAGQEGEVYSAAAAIKDEIRLYVSSGEDFSGAGVVFC